jgi:hypothetical protein
MNKDVQIKQFQKENEILRLKIVEENSQKK